jgi:hypothetical protein
MLRKCKIRWTEILQLSMLIEKATAMYVVDALRHP